VTRPERTQDLQALHQTASFPAHRVRGVFSTLVEGQGRRIARQLHCRGSRKDLRNAIVAARKAAAVGMERQRTRVQNRGQILYRIAEVCEFAGSGAARWSFAARAPRPVRRKREIERVIDPLGLLRPAWSDKYAQVFGSVKPGRRSVLQTSPSPSRPAS